MRKLSIFIFTGLIVANFACADFGQSSNSFDQTDKWQNIDKVQAMNPGGTNIPSTSNNSSINQPGSTFNNNANSTRPLSSGTYNQTNPSQSYYDSNPSAGSTFQPGASGIKNSSINRGSYPINAGGNPVNQRSPNLNQDNSSSDQW